MSTGITNTIRTALHDTVKDNLTPALQTLGLPGIVTWELYARERTDAARAPAVMFACQGWDQPPDGFSGGASAASGLRTIRFSVYILCTGSDEAEAEQRIANYADAVASILDDPDHRTLGNASVFETWPERATIGETGALTSGCYKAAELTVAVQYWHTVATYT